MSTIQLPDPDSEPDSSWSLEQLKSQISDEHNLLKSFRRKTAVHTYRLGRLLKLAKAKVPYGNWSVFLQQEGISIPTDNRARTLFELIESEEEIDGLSITEAYDKAGINIGKKTKAESIPVESAIAPKMKVQSVPINADVSDEDDDDDIESNDNVGDDDGDSTLDNDNGDDEELKQSDEVVSTLEIVASELDSVVTDRLPNIRNEEREEVRLAIQRVSNAHQRLLDAFFNGTEAV